MSRNDNVGLEVTVGLLGRITVLFLVGLAIRFVLWVAGF